jgi:amino acid adenylation domain-containing protein
MEMDNSVMENAQADHQNAEWWAGGSAPQGRSADAPAIDAPGMSDAERLQLAEWNATRQAVPQDMQDMSVPQLVARQAAVAPDAVALVMGSQWITYRQLNRRANRLAHHLQSLGVGPDIFVAVCLERSLDMVVGLLGTLKAGAAFVPLDPAYPAMRLGYMLEDSRAPVLITRQALSAQLPHHKAHVVCLDRDAALLVQHSGADPTPVATATHLAYLIYTSGSTGQPKGVQITHESMLNLIFWHQRAFAVSQADRATQLAGPGFDATVWELWPYLTIGATVYLPDEETRIMPLRLRDWLVEQRITMTFLPTALAESVMGLTWPKTTALRYLLTGADTLHHYPSRDLPFTVVNNYGPTENTVVTTSGPVPPTSGSAPPTALPPIGRPIANTEVYILDEQLRQVRVGEVGELHVGGAGLARGYLHQPDLTAERFIRHPFSDVPDARLYKTGDLARFLPDGQIAFLGRADTQIKIRGFRIEPDEIVSVLDSHPAVQASVVSAREQPAGDKSLVAYIVPAAGAPLTVGSLRAHLAAQLPDYMIPATILLLESLPLTPNGKVDRDALPEPNAANTLRDNASDEIEPRTMIEQRMAEIVSGLLKLRRIGLDDNFFLMGGHSMLGAELIERVAQTFGIDLPLLTLFEGPTVRQMSDAVERAILARVETLNDEEVERLLR